MSRIKFTQQIPFHEVGERFSLVGFGGTARREYEVIKTDGAVAYIVEIKDGKRKRGRPTRVEMVENYKEPEFFGVEIP